jgi:transposase-like protein
MVIGQANGRGRSIADVAQVYGLNANMVAKWRREDTPVQAPAPVEADAAAFLAVQMTGSCPVARPRLLEVPHSGIRAWLLLATE